MSGHDHSHGADAASQRGKLIIVFAITAAVMVAEIVGTFLTGSLALLADAGHMFTDAAGLLIALIARIAGPETGDPETHLGLQARRNRRRRRAGGTAARRRRIRHHRRHPPPL